MNIIDFRYLFAVTTLLALILGCSDANAGDVATYLPADQPCETTDHVDSSATTDDEPNSNLEFILHEYAPPTLQTDSGIVPASIEHGDLHDRMTPVELDETDEEPAALDESPPIDDDPGETVNINEADVDELTQLPGIGPALGERIVEYRRHRQFRQPDHLLRVDGIGPATFDEIAPEITVD